jgi:hypothetical protein
MKKEIKKVKLFRHDDHIDLSFSIDDLPFSVSENEKLNCGVKPINRQRGFTKGRIQIYIAKIKK